MQINIGFPKEVEHRDNDIVVKVAEFVGDDYFFNL